MKPILTLLLCAVYLCGTAPSYAESQDEDYLGVTDPFGDPTSYEFAEDEKADKEFFHLGRFIMIGVNLGAAIFTGSLGQTTQMSISPGGKLVYFFDQHIGLEFAVHYSAHAEYLTQSGGTTELFVNVIPMTAGIRYYFATKSAPKFIAMANPYLAGGGGYYLRSYSLGQVTGSPPALANSLTPNGQFGFYVGGGIEFPIYRRSLFLGLDLRYHFVFFFDEGISQLSGGLPRSGGLFIPAASITYNF